MPRQVKKKENYLLKVGVGTGRRPAPAGVPAGTWISEGKAASQGIDYPGGDYQAVITNIPNAWIIKTDKIFK